MFFGSCQARAWLFHHHVVMFRHGLGFEITFGFVIVSLVQLQNFHLWCFRLWALINLMTEAMRLFLSKQGGGSVIVARRYMAAMKTYRIGWCDCWQKKIEFELYGSLLSAYIQINSTKLIRWQPKHAIGVTSENKHHQLNMNAPKTREVFI